MLRGAGVLERGQVVDVAVDSTRETLISRITRLRLTYDGGGAGPSHLFWKSQRDSTDPQRQGFGRQEADFYRLVAADTPAGLLPRCYEASAEPGHPWHLALEDLTASHEAPGEWPLPPSIDRCHAVLEVHARFHAAWWNHPRLGVSVGTFADQSGAFDRYLAAMPTDLAAFADRLGDRLSAERTQRYERLIAAAPRLLERYRSHRDLTIVHGDAHFWNTMLPRRVGGDVRLIDWDAWRVDTATADLAYMLAVHCPTGGAGTSETACGDITTRSSATACAATRSRRSGRTTGAPCCGSSGPRCGRRTTTCPPGSGGTTSSASCAPSTTSTASTSWTDSRAASVRHA
jgi:phosphotransferase family enzyme